MPLLPVQAPPVARPGLIQPYWAVDVVHGTKEQLDNIRIRLLHGANFDDPAAFAPPDPWRMRVSTVAAGLWAAR